MWVLPADSGAVGVECEEALHPSSKKCGGVRCLGASRRLTGHSPHQLTLNSKTPTRVVGGQAPSDTRLRRAK